MRRTQRTIGVVLTSVVAIVLLLAGVLKLLNVGADDMIDGLKKASLDQHMQLISVTAIVCGALLLVPQTRRIGILAASAYWGGAMVAHLTYDDSVLMPAVFQAMLWIGAFLIETSNTRKPADSDHGTKD